MRPCFQISLVRTSSMFYALLCTEGLDPQLEKQLLPGGVNSVEVLVNWIWFLTSHQHVAVTHAVCQLDEAYWKFRAYEMWKQENGWLTSIHLHQITTATDLVKKNSTTMIWLHPNFSSKLLSNTPQNPNSLSSSHPDNISFPENGQTLDQLSTYD